MLCSTVCLTRLPDSAALWLGFVLCDTGSPRLSSLSLPVSPRRLFGALTLQQLLRTASPGEWSGPWWWRGRAQLLLTAFSPCTASTAGSQQQKKKKNIRQLGCYCIREMNYQKHTDTPFKKGRRSKHDPDDVIYLPSVLLESKSGFCGGVLEGWGEGVDCSAE